MSFHVKTQIYLGLKGMLELSLGLEVLKFKAAPP
jgi:hypothetical protein